MQFYGVFGVFIVYLWWYFRKLMANGSLFLGIELHGQWANLFQTQFQLGSYLVPAQFLAPNGRFSNWALALFTSPAQNTAY
jgi:hypothetical protein